MWFWMLRVMFPLRCVEGLQPWQRWRPPPRLALALIFGGCSDSEHAEASAAAVPGQPSVEIVSPRNGARQTSHAVVVKAIVENFRLAPRQFGREPQLGEGHIRFSLNRVPDCVDPEKLLDAINSPIGNGRLVGASFDYPPLRRPQRRPRRADRQRRQLLARRPGRRSTTTACRPASTAWSSTSPRTAARPPRSTPSPTSRSSPAPATARNRAQAAKSPAPRPPPGSTAERLAAPPLAARSPILHFV